ncbi:MAG: DUF262 domain-containing protein [Dehalococcoidales bacterium]|nr:DUF262 domain-containing protein [Dehalococcoidales bacterium]
MPNVNLDALIPREDFDVTEPITTVNTSKDTVSINDLKENDFFFSALRKPDFQRETNEWDSKRILSLIQSFVEGDLIPSLILWRSKNGFIFVIDGSHRLSALAAWINNDYGDGDISKQFYEDVIPEKQITIANRTRELIRKKIGLFADYELARTSPEKVPHYVAERANNLAAAAIRLQWVQGDSSKAEASFLKINQQGTPIDPTELRVIKGRKYPNAIAARAIIRSGKGHKYWSDFSEEKQQEIQEIAKDINKLLFNPDVGSPIKTMDLPIGGRLYAQQSLPLVLDFINIVNEIQIDNAGQQKDVDGSVTIKYLIRGKRIAQRINSSHAGSLGLHPLVYFYAINGHHKIASFFAVTALVMYLEKNNSYNRFTTVREKFEKLLIQSDYLVQQIVRKFRSAQDSYLHVRDFYLACMENLLDNKSIDDAVSTVINSKFNYLKPSIPTVEPEIKDFSKETKSEAFIREALKNGIRCKICGGYLHTNAISVDHIIRKEDGGSDLVENAQLAHPYCNTTFKN